MTQLRSLLAVASLLLAAGCGSGAADTTTRATDPRYPTTTSVGPSEAGPSPHDMRGGGRGSMGPHEKGK